MLMNILAPPKYVDFRQQNKGESENDKQSRKPRENTRSQNMGVRDPAWLMLSFKEQSFQTCISIQFEYITRIYIIISTFKYALFLKKKQLSPNKKKTL